MAYDRLRGRPDAARVKLGTLDRANSHFNNPFPIFDQRDFVQGRIDRFSGSGHTGNCSPLGVDWEDKAMTSDDSPTTPPAGTAWVGDWDAQFHDRVYGADPVAVGDIAALLTGVQHRNGSTVSGVAVRVDGGLPVGGEGLPIVVDLTPTQAREFGEVLIGLAERAEALDRIG